MNIHDIHLYDQNLDLHEYPYPRQAFTFARKLPYLDTLSTPNSTKCRRIAYYVSTTVEPR